MGESTLRFRLAENKGPRMIQTMRKGKLRAWESDVIKWIENGCPEMEAAET